jgi:hypothetical protein
MIHQNGQSLPQHDPVMELKAKKKGDEPRTAPINYSQKNQKGKQQKKRKMAVQWRTKEASSTHAMPIAL